jgi:GNAT superfamily N-acetyltransferase
MATPKLSLPILFTPLELKSNTALSASVTRLVNDAFYRSKETDPVKWSNVTFRFPNEDALHVMLGDTSSVMALIFDENADAERGWNGKAETNGREAGTAKGDLTRKKVVACAAAVPWKGGWMKEGANYESGWEIKTVCVDGDPNYHHRGLAVKLLSFLEGNLIASLKAQLRKEGKEGVSTLTLWILAAECINGVYWRKRGYQEVRRKTEGVGVWSCKTSFEMVVLKKFVTFDIDSGSSAGEV